jgi:monoamine oxidase
LKADERIGGRILTEEVDGVPLELGAQWIGDTHRRMETLAEELGVKIYDQFEDGETTYEFAGEALRGDAFHAKYAAELTGLERVLRELDRMADTVPVEVPWTAPRADEWDRITVGPVVRQQAPVPRRAHSARDLHGRHLGDADGRGLTALPAGERGRLRGDGRSACRVRGWQTKRFVGGTSLIPLRLAASLGDRIVLNSPVLTIDYSDDRVTVTCRGGLTATGRQVVVALIAACRTKPAAQASSSRSWRVSRLEWRADGRPRNGRRPSARSSAATSGRAPPSRA